MEQVKCLSFDMQTPNEAVYNTEEPKMRNCLVLSGQTRLSGPSLSEKVRQLINRVVDSATSKRMQVSDVETVQFLENELVKELRQLDTDLLQQIASNGRQGKTVINVLDEIVTSVTEEFQRKMDRLLVDSVVRNLHKRVKRKIGLK
jgi:uncharacterized membrane protein YheB (UPF0754 family)